MAILKKFRWPITVFLLGMVVMVMGSMLKITHHANAETFLWIATLLEVAGILFAIIILLISTSAKKTM